MFQNPQSYVCFGSNLTPWGGRCQECSCSGVAKLEVRDLCSWEKPDMIPCHSSRQITCDRQPRHDVPTPESAAGTLGGTGRNVVISECFLIS